MSLGRLTGAAALAGAAALLAACAVRPTRVPAPAAPLTAPSPARAVYRIDPSACDVRILVTRAGPLARFGHDHVIDTHAVSGWVRYPGAPQTAAFALEIPVASLTVDDPSRRREAGGEFAEPLDEEARNGTRTNMLSAAVLDADRYPTIVIRSVAVSGALPHLEATVAVELAGHSSQQQLAFDVDASSGRLRAKGELEIKQSALGLTPFSLFLGALRVEDAMRIRFDLVALAEAQ